MPVWGHILNNGYGQKPRQFALQVVKGYVLVNAKQSLFYKILRLPARSSLQLR